MSGQREDWTGKDTAQCVGMLFMTGGALAACTGNLTLDRIGAGITAATDAAMPVLFALAGVLAVLGVLVVTVRHFRAAITAWLVTWWRYRRRWAHVLHDLELTTAEAGAVIVPDIESVTSTGDYDVVRVRMLPGQSAGQWHDLSADLAEEFGAEEARVRLTKRRDRIEIVFVRDAGKPPTREPLALPAPQPHPLPLRFPIPQESQAEPDQVAVRLRGVQLQLIWARTYAHGRKDVRAPFGRWGIWGRVRWASQCAQVAI
jgi:hypothetical protein